MVAKDLGDWRSWAVLGYIHDDEDRFVGIAFHPQRMRLYATSWNHQRLFVL